MRRIIQITESQLKNVILHQLTEGGIRGLYKRKWEKKEHILAFYCAKFNDSPGLGLTDSQLADIIGTSETSFKLMKKNFDNLLGSSGLDRPHKLQTEIFKEYNDYSKSELKKVCKDIIKEFQTDEERKNTFEKNKLGIEIGDLRKKEEDSREKALKNAGLDPKRFTLIKSTKYDVKNKESETNKKEKEIDPLDVLKQLNFEPNKQTLDVVKELISRGWRPNNMVNESLYSVLKDIKQSRKKYRY